MPFHHFTPIRCHFVCRVLTDPSEGTYSHIYRQRHCLLTCGTTLPQIILAQSGNQPSIPYLPHAISPSDTDYVPFCVWRETGHLSVFMGGASRVLYVGESGGGLARCGVLGTASVRVCECETERVCESEKLQFSRARPPPLSHSYTHLPTNALSHPMWHHPPADNFGTKW